MTPDIQKVIEQIKNLEKELEEYWRKSEADLQSSFEGKRVRFTEEVRRLQKQYRVGLFRYVLNAELATLLTAPVIYAMIFPLTFLDITITIYQHICFRVYGIPRVRRKDFIVIDRHNLAYLNILEKLNCTYCGYSNGLIAYSREIISRTEDHWCPVRHAQIIRDPHHYYQRFFAFGDGKGFRSRGRVKMEEPEEKKK